MKTKSIIKMVSVLIGLVMLIAGCKVKTEVKPTDQDKVLTDNSKDETVKDDKKKSQRKSLSKQQKSRLLISILTVIMIQMRHYIISLQKIQVLRLM